MLDEIQVFIQVVDSNSFYKAAKVLKISTASVTRKVAKLESMLEVTLLNRNTRRFSLTSFGETCYKHCQSIPALLAELQQGIANTIQEPTGTLNLSVAAYSGYLELLPIVAQFLKKYPFIKINFMKSNIYPDLIDESFDIYFRYKEINTRTLQSKKLIDHKMICCATPDYLLNSGFLKKPNDLSQHNCIIHQTNLYDGDVWDFQDDKNKKLSLTVEGNLRLNNSALVLEAVLQGIGIARLPHYFFQQYINDGKLIEVLEQYTPPLLTVWLIHPRPAYMARKHQLFIEFIVNAYVKGQTTHVWS